MYDRPRTDWEQPGYLIGQHTNSRPLDWSRVDTVVIHYTADRRIPSDTARYLANIQRSYVDHRGYSIGYSAAVDQTGTTWQLRGEQWIPAATKDHNGHTYAILQLVDGAQPANSQMVAATRRLVGWAETKTGRPLKIAGHRDFGATQCPGDGVYSQIAAGLFRPVEDLDVQIIDPPQRIYDSRKQHGPFDAGETRKISTGRRGGVFVNVTVVDPAGWGYLTAWGAGPMPDVSIVNYKSETIANSAWVPVAADGTIQIYSYAGCHVLVDLQAGV